jgi:hypothetical protein
MLERMPCGQIRYEIVGPVGEALYCHCSMCRKSHGTAFRARLAVPKSSFRFVQERHLLTSYRSSADDQDILSHLWVTDGELRDPERQYGLAMAHWRMILA